MKNDIFWRAVLAGMLVIAVSMMYKSSIYYLLILWGGLFGLSFFTIKQADMKVIIDHIMSESFSNNFDFFYKCLIITTSVTIFLALLLMIFLYPEDLKEAPLNLIMLLSFTLTSAFLYFFSKKICFSTKNKD